MVTFSQSDAIAYQMRQAVAKASRAPTNASDPVERESTLAKAILAHCEAQWPRWKVKYARTDKKSTLPVGCHDQTVFASDGQVFCFELKRGKEKPSHEQLIWKAELANLGHVVHVIRSMEEFLEVVKP
jgi:hypothetical protein